MSARDALSEAGITSPIPIAGESVSIEAEPIGAGTRLRARVPMPSGAAQLAGDAVTQLELGAPGDTRVTVEGSDLVLVRVLVEPDTATVRDAAFALAKHAMVCVQPSTALAAAATADAQPAAVTPPEPSPPPNVDVVVARYYVVRASQSGWAEPDPSKPPAATLVPGRFYELLERLGDWARVQGPSGIVVYTDGRTLVPAAEGDQP